MSLKNYALSINKTDMSFLDDDDDSSLTKFSTPKSGRRIFGRRRYLMGFLMSNSRNINARITYGPLTEEEISKIQQALILIKEVTDNRQKNWELHKVAIIEKCKN